MSQFQFNLKYMRLLRQWDLLSNCFSWHFSRQQKLVCSFSFKALNSSLRLVSTSGQKALFNPKEERWIHALSSRSSFIHASLNMMAKNYKISYSIKCVCVSVYIYIKKGWVLRSTPAISFMFKCSLQAVCIWQELNYLYMPVSEAFRQQGLISTHTLSLY